MHKEIKCTLIQISLFLLLCVCLCGVCAIVFVFLNRCQFGNEKIICRGQVLSFYHWPRIEFRLSAFSIDPHFQPTMPVFTHHLSGSRTQSLHLHSPLRASCCIFSPQWNIEEGLVHLEVFSNINIKDNLFLYEFNTALNVKTYLDINTYRQTGIYIYICMYSW